MIQPPFLELLHYARPIVGARDTDDSVLVPLFGKHVLVREADV